jgi:hypothetical protein
MVATVNLTDWRGRRSHHLLQRSAIIVRCTKKWLE